MAHHPIDYDEVDTLVRAAMNETASSVGGVGSGVSAVASAAAADMAAAAKDYLGGCFNATVFEAYIRGVVRNATTLTREQQRRIEGDPLVYIVAVLIFYSCGIVVLMINYMKKVG